MSIQISYQSEFRGKWAPERDVRGGDKVIFPHIEYKFQALRSKDLLYNVHAPSNRIIRRKYPVTW